MKSGLLITLESDLKPQKRYNINTMYNWSTDTKTLKKDPAKYVVWKLEQLINFGLNGQKLDLKVVKKHWSKLSLDPKRKRVLEMWLA